MHAFADLDGQKSNSRSLLFFSYYFFWSRIVPLVISYTHFVFLLHSNIMAYTRRYTLLL